MWNVIGAVAAIGLATTAASADDAYPVNLSSPTKVGATCEITERVSRQFESKWTDAGNARKPSNENFVATFDGVQTVDAINKNGRPTKLTVRVKRCTKDGADLVPAGATIVAETIDGRTDLKVNGVAPADKVRDVLRELIYTARPY